MNFMNLLSNRKSDFTKFERQTMGLSPINKEAFAKMAGCGHRVVSIVPTDPSRFVVNTGCNSREPGSKFCKGLMEFSITPFGANLIQGQFSHDDLCFVGPNYESGEIEPIEGDNNSYSAIISNAKQVANSTLLWPGDDDFHQPPSELNPISPSNNAIAKRVINDLERLETHLRIQSDNPGVFEGFTDYF